MAVQVKGGLYSGDPRVVDKSVTELVDLQCKITDPFDVMNPILILSKTNDLLKCNYFSIGHRKYFKVREIKTSNKMVKLILSQDVISTWLPRVNVTGTVFNATETVSENINQDYLTDVNMKFSRVRIDNDYGEIQDDEPVIIARCVLPTMIQNSGS